MAITLNDFCIECKNYFEYEKVFNTFTIADGSIDLSSLEAEGKIQEGQYFRIAGSIFNDGVYQYPATGLTDETFNGVIWLMAVPKAVMDLITDVNDWLTKYGEQVNSPYQSESFGGYSYTMANGGNSGADAGSWQGQFKSRLNSWRKIRI